jgi:hypothetical protein
VAACILRLSAATAPVLVVGHVEPPVVVWIDVTPAAARISFGGTRLSRGRAKAVSLRAAASTNRGKWHAPRDARLGQRRQARTFGGGGHRAPAFRNSLDNAMGNGDARAFLTHVFTVFFGPYIRA